MKDLRKEHQRQIAELQEKLKGNTQKLRLRKKTISNLFRYEGRDEEKSTLDLNDFNRILFLDETEGTLDVQGLATYENIAKATIPCGYLPTVIPGFKHITIGGAVVGIAFESTSYRHGFVHDGLLEADVLLSDGKVVTCSPLNEHADLFYGLPNSYGTLGYIVRAKIRLRHIKPYVELTTRHFSDTGNLLDAMERATRDDSIGYIENLSYSKDQLYLTTGRDIDKATDPLSIYGGTIFYQEISKPGVIYLSAEDYVFRYDPEWFWGLPQSGVYSVFRYMAPRSLRNSGFYKRYYAWSAARAKKSGRTALPEGYEHLIQDWEVPWRHARALTDFALETVDLGGKPWLSTPVRTAATATSYPMRKDELYLNLGCYTFAKKKPGKESYYNTKAMDAFCFAHEGIKMLYSTTFMDRENFERMYAGEARARLKRKYDANGLLPSLFEKTIRAR